MIRKQPFFSEQKLVKEDMKMCCEEEKNKHQRPSYDDIPSYEEQAKQDEGAWVPEDEEAKLINYD